MAARPVRSVYIAYKWEDEAHNRWVERLCRGLRRNGFDTRLDKPNLPYGAPLVDYMAQHIGKECDAILVVITPAAVRALDVDQRGGLHYEVMLAVDRYIREGSAFRVIPVLREGEQVPLALRFARYADFRDDSKYEDALTDLVSFLLSEPEKPLFAAPAAPTHLIDFRALLAAHSNIVRGEWVWNRIRRFTRSRKGGCFLISGLPGTGKTAVLATLVLNDPGLPHFFFSRTRGITQPDDCVASLLRRLRWKYGRDNDPWPAEPRERRNALRTLLEELAGQGKSETLVVDGLDEADVTEGLNILQVLPLDPLRGIHWVLGCRQGTPIYPAAAAKCEPNHLALEPDDDSNISDAAEYLEQELSPLQPAPDLCRRLARNAEANFLYLQYFCGQARAQNVQAADLLDFMDRTHGPHGMHEEWWASLEAKLQSQPGVLSRAADILGLCAAAGRPLTVSMIAELLEAKTRDLRLPLEHVGQFLTEHERDGERWRSLYHDSFREFCREKFRDDLPGHYEALVSRSKPWRTSEKPHLCRFSLHLPEYQVMARRFSELGDTLSEPLFLEEKCRDPDFGVFDVIRDFNRALGASGLPEGIREKLLPWSRFVRAYSHILARRPDLFLQIAYNSAASGPVPEAAEGAIRTAQRPYLRRLNRPSAVSLACIQVLEGHQGEVSPLALAADGKRAVTGSEDKTVRVWDLERGAEVACFFAEGGVTACAVAPTGVIVAGDALGNVYFLTLEEQLASAHAV